MEINGRKIGNDEPTYFIADIGANHDGDIDRAMKLVSLAKESGADAVKFQHFKAEKIVSDKGFKHLVGEITREEFIQGLRDYCKEIGVDLIGDGL